MHQHSTNPGQAYNTTLTATLRRSQPPKHADAEPTKQGAHAEGQNTNNPNQRRGLPGGTDDNPSPAPPHHAQPERRAGTNTARPTMRRATHQHSTAHHEAGPTTTQHTRP